MQQEAGVRGFARSWARRVSAEVPVRWNELDFAAVRGYAHLERVIDPTREYGRERAGRLQGLVEVVWRLVFALTVFAVWVCPSAVGLVFLGGASISYQRSVPAGEYAVALPGAGIAFGVSMVSLLVAFVGWWTDGRAKDSYFRGRALFALLFGGVCMVIVAAHDSVADVALWRVWVGLIIASTVVAAVFLVALVTASRTEQQLREAQVRRREPYRRVRRAIDRLPEAERCAMEDDVRGAIEILLERGVIDDALARKARGVELGKLAWYMTDQPE